VFINAPVGLVILTRNAGLQVSIAITGEAFIEGARHATDLLKRNFLKAYGVWWFPPMVLQTSAFLFSLAWATLIGSLYYMLDSKRPAIGQVCPDHTPCHPMLPRIIHWRRVRGQCFHP
jgi:hypothetical protein